MEIRYFVRKRIEDQFSIEEIFSAVCRYVQRLADTGFHCELDELPFYFSPINFFRNIAYVRRHQGDVNHITGDIHYAILGCSRSRLNVLTIHDCVILTKYRKWDIRYWIFRILWYEWPMAKADIITVISEKTKAELMKTIWSGKDKITVVNNFVDPAFKYSPKEFNREKPVLLFIGSTPNKNLDRVLQSIRGLNCRLDIVGRITESQREYIRTNKLDVTDSLGLTRTQMLEKYQNSDIVLFPSTYEGFGMLIVEANAVGRPVVTSDISPMKEVAGDAGVLVDPLDSGSIRDGILKVIANENFRDRLVADGRRNIERFQIGTIVNTYLGLYVRNSRHRTV